MSQNDLSLFTESLVNVVQAKNQLSQKMSENDAIINEIYHCLEFMELDAIKQTKLVKKLREALKKRRQWKEILAISDACFNNGKFPSEDNLTSILNKREKRTQEWLEQSQEILEKYV